MISTKNFESILKKDNIDEVQICYIDYSGRLCGKLIPSSKIETVVNNGIVFAKANLSFGLDDHFADNAKFLANSGDLLAVPEFDSYAIMHHRPGVARFNSIMLDDKGQKWLGCPRNQLIKILKEFQDLNIQIKLSFETEFSIYKKENENFIPFSFDSMFTISGMDKLNQIWNDISKALSLANIKIEQVGKEYGPGQYEATWQYDDVMQSIDKYINYKDFIKSIIHDHGFLATFMPKPFDHLPGNGLHLHLSLWDQNNKEISCSDNDEFPLSNIGSNFVAGLLLNAHSLTATGCSSVNSYKRILPGSWSPAHICWGKENRSTLIRIPGKGKRRHIELRHGDNLNNPYIYLISVLASGLMGIKNKLTLEDPILDDAGQYSDNINISELKVLPRSLNESLSYLKDNKIINNALGSIIFDEFIKIKETELRQYETTVHSWERDRYIDIF